MTGGDLRKAIRRVLWVRPDMSAAEIGTAIYISLDDETPLWLTLADMAPNELRRETALRGYVYFLREKEVPVA